MSDRYTDEDRHYLACFEAALAQYRGEDHFDFFIRNAVRVTGETEVIRTADGWLIRERRYG